MSLKNITESSDTNDPSTRRAIAFNRFIGGLVLLLSALLGIGLIVGQWQDPDPIRSNGAVLASAVAQARTSTPIPSALITSVPTAAAGTTATLDVPSPRPATPQTITAPTTTPVPTSLPTSGATGAPTAGAVATQVCQNATVIEVQELAVRAEPNWSAALLTSVPRGQSVGVLCGEPVQADNRSWLPVQVDGKVGWMSSRYLQLASDAATPTVAAEAAPLTYAFPVAAEACNYGRYHHDYPATDIFCPIGSQFVAVTSGTVDFVSTEDRWDPANDDPALRSGMAVAIIGDDGVRYYGSHLSAVAEGITPGARVTTGQLLGYTGQSGNARATPPHLHFGISRPTTPDDWQVRRGEVAPYDYLQAWERGRNVTPTVGR